MTHWIQKHILSIAYNRSPLKLLYAYANFRFLLSSNIFLLVLYPLNSDPLNIRGTKFFWKRPYEDSKLLQSRKEINYKVAQLYISKAAQNN